MITITALPSRAINIGRLPDMTPEPAEGEIEV